MSETTLSIKGQIVIPLRVRGKLGLRAGQRFEVEAMSDGTVLLIPVPDEVVDAMELPAAEKLEKALAEERLKEGERHEEMVGELKGQCGSS
jgi:AbrB family looped-hinge helix DNA binding protein